jgi:hypothetical protein
MYKILLALILFASTSTFGARAADFDAIRIIVEAPDVDQPKADGLERYLTFKNPLNRGEYIRFSVETREELSYEIYNLVGKLVYRATPEVKDGRQYVEIPTDELQSGIYFLKVSGNKSSATKRFVLS